MENEELRALAGEDSSRRRMADRTTFFRHRAGRLCATIALQGTELVGLYVSPGLGFYLQNGWCARQKVIVGILGVDFEETSMFRRLRAP